MTKVDAFGKIDAMAIPLIEPLLVRKPYPTGSSAGERAVSAYLIKRNIRYTPQKTFPELVSPITGAPLFLDFWLDDEYRIIELDGRQHFGPVGHFGGQDAFEVQRRHDAAKNVFAAQNEFHMIRVPYYIRDAGSITPFLNWSRWRLPVLSNLLLGSMEVSARIKYARHD